MKKQKEAEQTKESTRGGAESAGFSLLFHAEAGRDPHGSGEGVRRGGRAWPYYVMQKRGGTYMGAQS